MDRRGARHARSSDCHQAGGRRFDPDLLRQRRRPQTARLNSTFVIAGSFEYSDQVPPFPGAKYSAIASVRAATVYLAGLTTTSNPRSAAVAAVIGPIAAALRTLAVAPHRAQKFVTVLELVNVTRSIDSDAISPRMRSICAPLGLTVR